MSKWLEKLSPASFRGVPFYLIEDPTEVVGRRRANHEYAGRDTPKSEDTGRKQRTYTVAGGVDGDDFIEKANKLKAAFEEQGAGKLVHPYLGELMVLGEATFTYQGRFASFVFKCDEAGEDANPSSVVDTRGVVASKSSLAQQASIDSFVSSYDVSGPEFVRELTFNNMLDSLQLLGGDLSSSVDDLSGLIQQPKALADSLFSMVASIPRSPSVSNNRVAVLGDLGVASQSESLVQAVPVAKTKPRQRIEKNNQSVNQLVSRAVVIEESRALIDMDFESQSQAQSQVNTVVDALDDVSWQSDDVVYRQMVDLRVAVQQDMQARIPSLPRLQTVKLNQMVPALVAAYRYTGDAANEQQIIDRNSVTHPGFIRGDIEVVHV